MTLEFFPPVFITGQFSLNADIHARTQVRSNAHAYLIQYSLKQCFGYNLYCV